MTGAPLKEQYRKCRKCGTEAEVIGNRALTYMDVPALGVLPGPSCYGVMLLCNDCGATWIVLAADNGHWYGLGGSD